jgi:predicted nucleotidyltransferase/predicted transcriptional regulator
MLYLLPRGKISRRRKGNYLMRIQATDVLAGQPALALRKLMQQGRKLGPTTDGNSLETIAEILEVDLATAKTIFQELCKEGFIEPARRRSGSGAEETYQWYTTIKGNALANASARKPVTRKTADRVVEQFLERVQQVNEGDYAYRVKRAILFGSYLGDAATLGDVDVSIELEDRAHDPTERQRLRDARIALAEEAGRHFRDFMEELFWPEQEVLLLLKHRSPTLSLHDEERERVLQRDIPSKILFEADSPTP